jgi:hypothetical protein
MSATTIDNSIKIIIIIIRTTMMMGVMIKHTTTHNTQKQQQPNIEHPHRTSHIHMAHCTLTVQAQAPYAAL